MPVHRANKSRRPKFGFHIDPITENKKTIDWTTNMPWFNANTKRNKTRNKIAKLSRKQNRGK